MCQNAQRQVDTPVVVRAATNHQTPLHGSALVEQKQRHAALQDQKRFRFGRVFMAVRTNVATLQKYVQKAVRIVVRTSVKVVVQPAACGTACLLHQVVKQRTGSELDQVFDGVLDIKTDYAIKRLKENPMREVKRNKSGRHLNCSESGQEGGRS